MKKAGAFLLILCVAAAAASAQVRVGVFGGYSAPSDSNYKGAVAFGGVLAWDAMKYLTIEARVFTSQYQVTGSEEGLSAGKLSVLPIQVALMLKYPVSEMIAPYILAGGGYMINKFTLDAGLVSDWDSVGFDLEESIDSGMVLQFGAGVELTLAKQFGIGIDARYLLSKADGSWSLTDQGGDASTSGTLTGLKLDSLVFGLSLKYVF